jgi:hypothetical protein
MPFAILTRKPIESCNGAGKACLVKQNWVLEGHRLAQTVAYADLGSGNPAPITPAYERQAGPVIELQLEKAGVRFSVSLSRCRCVPMLLPQLRATAISHSVYSKGALSISQSIFMQSLSSRSSCLTSLPLPLSRALS